MVDVASVKAALQRTPKGKLRYSSGSENVDCDLSTSFNLSINISPNLLFKPERRLSSKYKEYYSPERTLHENEESFQSSPDESIKNKTKIITSPSSHIMTPSEKLYNQSQKEKQQIDKELKEELDILAEERIEKMKYILADIHEEYENSIEFINYKHAERAEIHKQKINNYETKLNQSNDEIKNFQKQIEEQNRKAKIRLHEIENIRNIVEEKKKAVELERQTRLKLCKQLQDIAEHGKVIIMEATGFIKTYSEKGYENIELLNACHSEIVNQYSLALTSIREGLDSQTNLDVYIRDSQSKIDHMEMLKEKIESTLQANDQKVAESQKLLEEQKKIEQAKLEEDEKRKLQEQEAKKLQEQEKRTLLEQAKAKESNSVSQQLTTQTAKAEVEQTSQNAPQTINVSISSFIPELSAIEASLKPILNSFTSIPAFASYLKLRKVLSDTETNIAPLNKSSEKEKKTYKFDLYKVVNTCINAISDESPTHLLDKITKLNKLLTGERVEMGNKSITINDDPCALLLCKDLLARKLVSQGVSQVSSSFKAAFPIAVVCVSLWSLHGDCGDLIMAHFYKVSPLLVPFYLPKVKELSTQEYFSFIGFDVKDGKIEEEDKFLKKLSGLVRLYAAIFCTPIPPQLGNRKHPHGLEHAWTWFTRLLNLEPLPVYTANILYDFLEVAGYFLMEKYGKQFQKLLFYVCQSYVPKIIQVTPASSKASATRLQLFLENCIKSNKFNHPEGHLNVQWWRRY